jgi:hypothetical protein
MTSLRTLKKRENSRHRYQANREEILAKQRQWRLDHPDEARAQYKRWHRGQREYRQAIKEEVLTYYGSGKCACVKCGESRLACLTLDHINGNGCKERREGKIKRGNHLYFALRKSGYPKGYQTLCMNCQFVKRWLNGEDGRQSQ